MFIEFNMLKLYRIFFLVIIYLFVYNSCKNPDSKLDTLQTVDPELQLLNESIQKDPENDSLYFYKAFYYFERDSYEVAIVNLNKALSIDSTFKPAYYQLLADVYLANIQSREAVEIIDKALIYFPNEISVILKSSQIKLILKQHMAALATLNKIFIRDPQNAEAYYLAGHIFYEMGDTGRAVNSYQKAVDFNPDMRAAWVQLGDVLSDLKNPRAISYYQNAILLDSIDPEIFHKKAFALYSFGKTAEAIALYKRSCLKFPNYEPFFFNLGFIYLELDSLDKAIEHFTIATQLNPVEASGFYQRGIAYQQKGVNAQAKTDFQQALQLDSTLELAKIALRKLK